MVDLDWWMRKRLSMGVLVGYFFLRAGTGCSVTAGVEACMGAVIVMHCGRQQWLLQVNDPAFSLGQLAYGTQ